MTTYHLRPDGNDSANGLSYANGWATFEKADAVMGAGDDLQVHAGVYVEWVRWDTSGTLANPITITAAGDGDVWLDGEYSYPTNVAKEGDVTPYGTYYDVSYSGLFELRRCSHVRVSGINVKRSQGRGVYIYGDRSAHESGCRFQNALVINNRFSCLNVDGCDDSVVSDVEMYDSSNFAPFKRPTSYLNHPGCFNVKHVNNTTIYNCTMHDSWGEGIIIGSNAIGGVFYNNTLYDCFSNYLYFMACQNWEAYGNLIYATPNAENYRDQRSPGIVILSEDPKTPSEDTTQIDGIVVHDNIVINTADGVRVGRGQPWPDGYPTNRNVWVYNNHFIQPVNGECINVHSLALLVNVNIYDNVCTHTDATNLAFVGSQSELHMGPNAWSATPSDTQARHAGDKIGTFGMADPYMTVASFTSPTIADLLPSESSVIIDASTTSDSTVDYRGYTRIGTPDMGALEVGATEGGSGDPPTEGGGQVTKEARTEAKQSNGTSVTFSHTHPSVTDDALIVIVHAMRFQTGQDPITLSGVTFNGVALTELVAQQGDTTNRDYITAIYYKVGAATGANNVVVTSGNGAVERWIVNAVSFSGVNQSDPIVLGLHAESGPSWGDGFTVTDGNDVWFAITARSDSNAMSVNSGYTLEYESDQTTGGTDTDMMAAAVWRNYNPGGNILVEVPGGPETTRGPTWAWFMINSAALYEIAIELGSAQATVGATAPTVVLGDINITLGTAEVISKGTRPTVTISDTAGVTIQLDTAEATSGANVHVVLSNITIDLGSAQATAGASIGSIALAFIAAGVALSLPQRNRTLILPQRSRIF